MMCARDKDAKWQKERWIDRIEESKVNQSKAKQGKVSRRDGMDE